MSGRDHGLTGPSCPTQRDAGPCSTKTNVTQKVGLGGIWRRTQTLRKRAFTQAPRTRAREGKLI